MLRAIFLALALVCAAFCGAIEEFDARFAAAEKSQRLALHQRLKSLYIKSIINDDDALRGRTLQRLVLSCNALGLSAADYSKELAALGLKPLQLEDISPKKPAAAAKPAADAKAAAAKPAADAKAAGESPKKSPAPSENPKKSPAPSQSPKKSPAPSENPKKPAAAAKPDAKPAEKPRPSESPKKPAAKPAAAKPAAAQKIYLTAAHAHSKNGRAGVLLKFSAQPQKPAASSYQNTAILSLPAALDTGRKRFSAGASVLVAQFDPQTVRISATADELPKLAYEMGKNEIFVYVDSPKPAATKKPAAKKPAAKPAKPAAKPAKPAATAKPATKPAAKPAAPAKKPAVLPAAAKSQLLITIDAGHGGKDSGASAHGRSEKHITLAIAKQLDAALRARGYRTKLTRSKDVFITLRGRTKIANDVRSDLFISVHANSLADKSRYEKVQGIETYFLSPARSERSKNAAAAENKSDIEEMNYFSKQTFLNFLNREKIIASNKLAIDIQAGMLGALRSYKPRDGGVKEAPFWVLVGAQMPAVLVEVGYITHPQEGARIAQPAYQRQLAAGIAAGVDNYFKKNKF